jgi:hypothetical protein
MKDQTWLLMVGQPDGEVASPDHRLFAQCKAKKPANLHIQDVSREIKDAPADEPQLGRRCKAPDKL